MSKLRFDYAELTATRTDEGYLKDSPIVARTGILTYRNADGSIRKELRRPEQVFHKDSLASFVGKPITVDHPTKSVTSEDIEKFQVGTMLAEGRQDGNNVRADIIIHKPNKLGDRRQLSLGYEIELDETPGEYQGERYDAEQINIRVNHLSVVKKARAGAHARLNMDSDEIIEIEPETLEKPVMPKIRLDGIEYEASQEVINALDKQTKRADEADSKLVDVNKQVQTVTGERDTLKARVDGFPAELKAAEEKAVSGAKAAIEGRANLEKIATTFKVDSKDKTDDQIKHAVIKTFNKDFDETGKTPEYVQAAFDIAVSTRKDDALQTQRLTVKGAPANGAARTDADATDPREEYRNSLGSNAVKSKE